MLDYLARCVRYKYSNSNYGRIFMHTQIIYLMYKKAKRILRYWQNNALIVETILACRIIDSDFAILSNCIVREFENELSRKSF